MSPKVSVIVPACNSEKTIAQTLQSVIRQTYKDWELIVIDDGSTDATAAIVGGFDDPRIRLIRKTNGGTSSARNKGIIDSCARYLQFLDADDLILPKKLSCQVEILDNDPNIGVVYCSFRYLYNNYCEIHPPEWLRAPTDDPFRELVAGSMFPPHAALVRSSLVKEVGLFDEAIFSGEDWDFWLRLARMGVKFQYHDDLLALYRQHPESKTRSRERWRRAHVQVIEKVREYTRDDVELERIRWNYHAAYNYVLWALALLSNGEDEAARNAFSSAYFLSPNLGHPQGELAKLIADHAIRFDQQTTNAQVTGEDWLENVGSCLPNSFPSTSVIRESRVLYWHAKAIGAYEGDSHSDVRRYVWRMVSQGRTNSWNLGVISIFLQSIIGKNNWRKLKKVWH